MSAFHRRAGQFRRAAVRHLMGGDALVYDRGPRNPDDRQWSALKAGHPSVVRLASPLQALANAFDLQVSFVG
jgi:hypothetical protein